MRRWKEVWYRLNATLTMVAVITLFAVAQPMCFGQPRTQRRTSSSTPQQTFKSIREVDFNNFVYRIRQPIGVEGIRGEQIAMRKGIGTGSNPEGSGCEYRVESISYGYLISEGQEDAVIVIGCSLKPGSGYSNAGYIYGLRRGQPTLLAEVEGGNRSDGLILGLVIASPDLIVIRDYVELDPPRFQAITYKWSGRKLVEAGRAVIRRIQ